jgi:hypothetical protein
MTLTAESNFNFLFSSTTNLLFILLLIVIVLFDASFSILLNDCDDFHILGKVRVIRVVIGGSEATPRIGTKLLSIIESSRISNKSARSTAVRLHLCLLVKQDIFYEK